MPVWSRQELLLGTLLSHGLYVHFGCGCWFHCCLASSACITCLGSLMMPFLFSRWFALCDPTRCLYMHLNHFFYFLPISVLLLNNEIRNSLYAATSPRISKRHFALSLSPSAFCTPNAFFFQCYILGIDPI